MGLIVTNPEISLQANNGSPRIYYFADGAALFGCIGSPEGVIVANARSLAITEAGVVYVKTTNGVATGWSAVSGGGGGSIGGSIAATQVAVGSGANTIAGSSALTFASGGLSNLQSIAGECGFLANQAVSGAASSAYFYMQTPSSAGILRLTTAGFTPTGLIKANQVDIYGGSGAVEMLLRLQDASTRFVFGINNGEAMSVNSTTTENLALGSPSTGAVPRNAQIKFYNATNAFYTQLRATAFAANRIWDLPTGSPTGTQALVGTLSGSTITLDWQSVSAALTSTQIGFGSGANVLTGSADFTYADATGVIDLVKTGLNSSVRFVVTNSNVGNAAQARVAVSADTSGAALIAYSSAFTTSGLRVANSCVLDLDGPNAVILGQAAGVIQLGLGVTEYARLNTTRLGLLGLGLGTTPSSLDVLLERDAANVLAQRNGTNAQTFRVYNTYTDASNYERVNARWASNVFEIFTDQSGTGSARRFSFGTSGNNVVRLFTNNVDRWEVQTAGHLVTSTDNTYDIGQSGATRPRAIYVADNVTVGQYVHATSFFSAGNGGRIYSPADGVLELSNATHNDFSRLQFGGTSTSFPAIGRSNASLVISLADGTLATNILPINTNQLQFGGADAASPGAISLRVQNVLAGTSNTSGQNLSIFGSAGTGNAVGGQILLRVAPAGSSGTTQNSTIVGLGVTGAGQVYGAALHNNAAGMSGTTNQYVGSGTYTPTVTAVANCAATAAGTCSYMRVGNIVTVSGQVTVDPTTTLTLTQVGISLPIASNLTSSNQCNGAACDPLSYGESAAIAGDATNDRAELQCTPTQTANHTYSFTFTYEVL